MNLSDCIAIYRTLGDNADKNLGMRNNYNVALNLKSLETIIKPFDDLRTKKLEELKEKHGEEEVPQEDVNAFNEELFTVLQEEHDVKLKNIKIKDIPSKTELTAGFFVACQEIVTE